MAQFTQVFFDEAKEHLSTIEEVLLRLDIVEPDLEDLNAIFRAAHSIKGGAGTFGFSDMAAFTHVMETLLDRLRKEELQITAAMVDALLEGNDVIGGMLEAHQSGGEADASVEQGVRARLEALSTGAEPPEPARAPVPVPVSGPVSTLRRFRISFVYPDSAGSAGFDNLVAELKALGSLQVVRAPSTIGGKGSGHGRGKAGSDCELLLETAAERGELTELFEFVVSPGALRLEETVDAVAVPQSAEDSQGFGFFEEAVGAPARDPGFGFFEDAAGSPDATAASGAPQSVEPEGFGFFDEAPGAPEPQDEAPAVAPDPAPPVRGAGRRAIDQADSGEVRAGRRTSDKAVTSAAASADTSIRVSVEKVDQLLNLVGELVITQSMLAQAISSAEHAGDKTLASGIAQLQRNSRDLQEAVMSVRMLPIAFVFSRFPRLVRDIAGKLGKNVDLKLVGENTEVDKGVIEKIADPLTHLVRNSLDHGLESPADRVAKGKSANGTITLRAFHQGGNIIIEVADDGRGLDRNKILAKARSRGMPVDDAMTDSEVFGLIFEAGFSTAEQVTDISGRGVGMDVVRRNIMALGGRVEISSEMGKGCTVSIRLPLTLAILDGISVALGDSLYIVPLGFIIESFQPRETDIRTIGGKGHVMQVRGDHLPVIRLNEMVGGEARVHDFHKGITVIIEAVGGRAALFVDELVGQHQVVIKSLETNYRKVPFISAATIMGDGRVAMILDIAEIVNAANAKRPHLEAA